jgi:hypothetical protein
MKNNISTEFRFGWSMQIGSVEAEIHPSRLVCKKGASISKVPAFGGNGYEFRNRNMCSNPQMKINRWTLK